jgi:uncharacterized protein (DUF4415 family)
VNDYSMKYRTADRSPLTPAEIARLEALEAHIGDIDDIPETSDAAWATAQRGKHTNAAQAAISVRLDAEVVAWLRAKGPGYSTGINRILREKMLGVA